MSYERACERPMRVGDRQRQRYSEHLNDMYSKGYINPREYAERLDKVWTARFEADLKAIVMDLPAMPSAKVVKKKRLSLKSVPLPFRWVTGLAVSLFTTVFYPVGEATAAHGLGNAPGFAFAGAMVCLIAGCVSCIVCLIATAITTFEYCDEKQGQRW